MLQASRPRAVIGEAAIINVAPHRAVAFSALVSPGPGHLACGLIFSPNLELTPLATITLQPSCGEEVRLVVLLPAKASEWSFQTEGQAPEQWRA